MHELVLKAQPCFLEFGWYLWVSVVLELNVVRLVLPQFLYVMQLLDWESEISLFGLPSLSAKAKV